MYGEKIVDRTGVRGSAVSICSSKFSSSRPPKDGVHSKYEYNENITIHTALQLLGKTHGFYDMCTQFGAGGRDGRVGRRSSML